MEHKKLYTKTGDHGETAIGDGLRVAKDDIRIDTNGEIDELNSWLGVVGSMLPTGDGKVEEIKGVQRRLMEFMAVVASPKVGLQLPGLGRTIEMMECQIDEICQNRAFNFVLPGGMPVSAFLHVARCKARTCERRLWTLNRQYPIDPNIMVYMNRLSDYLFALSQGMR